MKSESDFKSLSEYLTEIGCCRTCVLRFLKPNIDDFLDVEKSLENVNKKLQNKSKLAGKIKLFHRKTSQTTQKSLQ